jgi:hypothetical protein
MRRIYGRLALVPALVRGDEMSRLLLFTRPREGDEDESRRAADVELVHSTDSI